MLKVCAILALLTQAAPDPETPYEPLENCYVVARLDCYEVGCEAGYQLGGQTVCVPEVYDRCLAQHEADCRVRFPPPPPSSP